MYDWDNAGNLRWHAEGTSLLYLAGTKVGEEFWNWTTGQRTATYHHTDLLGSSVAETNASRSVTQRTEYAPYGEPLNRSVDEPGYTGHVHDAVTELIYAQQRYYDPVVGQFLSTDPMQVDPTTGWNFNRYSYGHNNPYRYTDPDGRGIYTKLYKLARSRGDIPLTFAGAIEDYNTMTDSEASLGQRALAAASLVSEFAPISGRDIGDGVNILRNIGDGSAGSRSITNQIDDLVSSSRPGKKTTGPTTQFTRSGGFEQANKEFDALNPSNIKEIDTGYGTGRTGTLSDGRQVVVRPGSSNDGPPTLEIQDGRSRIKFRFDEDTL